MFKLKKVTDANGIILPQYNPTIPLQDIQKKNNDDLDNRFYTDSNGQLLQKFKPVILLQDIQKMVSSPVVQTKKQKKNKFFLSLIDLSESTSTPIFSPFQGYP